MDEFNSRPERENITASALAKLADDFAEVAISYMPAEQRSRHIESAKALLRGDFYEMNAGRYRLVPDSQ